MARPAVSVYADIAAPPGRVWDLVSDIGLLPRFSTELRSVEWADGYRQAQLGAQFLSTNKHPEIGAWTTRSHITEFEPLHVFGWSVGDPNCPVAVWRFELNPTADGTRLSYTARIGPGRSGVTMLIEREPDRARDIVDGRLRQFTTSMEATIAGIKVLAESP